MRNYNKKRISLILLGLFLNIFTIHCQTNNDIILHNWFDNTVGKVNLEINKGVFYTNSYPTLGNNNIYLVDNKFTLGSLTYDNQIYYDTKLNYDIYRDILILNPHNSESIGINLNKEKVNSFSIYNKNFVKINNDQYNLAEFTTGYYETLPYENNIILYIKHHKKNSNRTIKEDLVYYIFKNDESYYIDYKKVLYRINGKSDLIKVFPEEKKKISQFYSTNKNIKTTDPNQFIKNIVKSIIPSDHNSAKK